MSAHRLFTTTTLFTSAWLAACGPEKTSPVDSGEENTPSNPEDTDTDLPDDTADPAPSPDEDADGVSVADGDCDDHDASVNPGATEQSGSGVDEDCDGLIDEGDWSAGDLVISEVFASPTGVADADGQWIEVMNTSGRAVALNGLTLRGSGFDASLTGPDPLTLAPGAVLVLGGNNDPLANGGVAVDVAVPDLRLARGADSLSIEVDGLVLDRVSWGATSPGASTALDPDFTDAALNDDWGAWCDGAAPWGETTDSGSPGAPNSACTHLDHDGDGVSADDGDCEDADAAVHPGAEDAWYDGVDQDCSGGSDYDQDGDGFESAAYGGGDCDDDNVSVNPDASERCDALDVDEDCNGLANDDDLFVVDAITWYRDADEDGYGDPGDTLRACVLPAGYTADATDCDDDSGTTSPDQVEVLEDGLDNDCDGVTDPVAVSLTLTGSKAQAKFGVSLDAAGDINGDGQTDLIIGASVWDSPDVDVGGAFLFTDLSGGTRSSATAAAILEGAKSDDYAGTSVAGPGDLDGDGYDDLVIGAPGESTAASAAGTAYVLSGPLTGTLSLRTNGLKLTGAARSDYAGSVVSRVGDLDADGADDLLVTAPLTDDLGATTGTVYLVLGPISSNLALSTADAIWLGQTAGDSAGVAARGGGDVNGDGLPDLIIGANANDEAATAAGASYLLLGPATAGGSLADADARLLGVAASDFSGSAVASLQDSDGDGYDDLAVGAYVANNGSISKAGAAWLMLGPVSGDVSLSDAALSVVGLGTSDYLGGALDLADVSGDGQADLLIGAYGTNTTSGTDSGALYVVLGGTSGALDVTEVDAWLPGVAADENSGGSLVGLGDVDGDGAEDLLLGATGAYAGSRYAGRVTLMLGGSW